MPEQYRRRQAIPHRTLLAQAAAGYQRAEHVGTDASGE
jgi:hypothetical protein